MAITVVPEEGMAVVALSVGASLLGAVPLVGALVVRMVPPILLAIPLYIVLGRLELLDTKLGPDSRLHRAQHEPRDLGVIGAVPIICSRSSCSDTSCEG